MKRRFILAVTLFSSLALGGCRTFSDRVLWQDATLVNDTSERAFPLYAVRPGQSWVFEITDGWHHGHFSTAHGGHDSVYLTLLEKPAAEQEYRFSSEDGSLAYSGFHGSSFTSIPSEEVVAVTGVSPAQAATATLRVRSVGRLSVKADVNATVPFVEHGFRIRTLAVKETCRFRIRKAEQIDEAPTKNVERAE